MYSISTDRLSVPCGTLKKSFLDFRLFSSSFHVFMLDDGGRGSTLEGKKRDMIIVFFSNNFDL